MMARSEQSGFGDVVAVLCVFEQGGSHMSPLKVVLLISGQHRCRPCPRLHRVAPAPTLQNRCSTCFPVKSIHDLTMIEQTKAQR